MTTPDQPNGNRRLREGAATITAVAVVAAIVAATVAAWLLGRIEADTALAFLGPISGGATIFLWNRQASKDAADAALAQPPTYPPTPRQGAQ